MTEMTVDILGTHYAICFRTEDEDKTLRDCDGYTDWTKRRIVIEREVKGNLGDMDVYIRKVLRHEIVHAFLSECGLNECSGETDCWARNETMVDWFARMGERIYRAWEAAGALG